MLRSVLRTCIRCISPDGKKLAFTSAKNGDYFGLSSLFVYDFATHKETLVQPGVRTAPAWSPDGTKLYYGKMTRGTIRTGPSSSISMSTISRQKKERRVTSGKRATESDGVSGWRDALRSSTTRDGTSNLAVVNRDGSGYREITLYANGEQVYNPSWSPDGSRIVFDYSIKDGRDIAWVRPDGSDLAFLVTGEDDARAARFSPDGQTFWFSSDRSGIFNVYRYDLASQRTEQMTNVLGGAFYPTVNAAGDLVYAAYTVGGYKLYTYPAPGVVPER